MEATLLFSAVLIALGGVMFESGRFDSEYYDVQRQVIMYCVFFVIAVSIGYFFVVAISEVLTTFSPGTVRAMRQRLAGRGQKVAQRLEDTEGADDDEGPEVEMSSAKQRASSDADTSFGMNPMFMGDKKTVAVGASARADWGVAEYQQEWSPPWAARRTTTTSWSRR